MALKAPLVRIPLGVTMAAHEGLDPVLSRAVLEIPSDVPVVLYVGRLTDEYKADRRELLQDSGFRSSAHGKLVGDILTTAIAPVPVSAWLDRRADLPLWDIVVGLLKAGRLGVVPPASAPPG